MTLSELQRMVERQERRFADFVRTDYYIRDMNEIRGDIHEIKESQKWAQRLTITVLIGLVVQIVLLFAR